MIDIVKTPIENAVLFNNSPLEIIVDSVLGADYYFRLLVRVDGEDYDEQQHSKIDDNTCVIDFKNDISDVFNQEFSIPTLTTIKPLPGLMKEVRLIVREYQKNSNALVNELELPPFFLINANQNSNLVLNTLTPLSIYDTKIKAPSDGLITFPFFSNEAVQVEVIVNNTIQFSFNTDVILGVYAFNILLSDFNLTPSDAVQLVVTEIEGLTSFERQIEIIDNTAFDNTPIVVENNFNAWEYFYCFGEKQTKPNYKRHVLKQNDLENHPYKVSRTDTFKLNTGWFSKLYYSAVGAFIEGLNFYYFENDTPVKAELLTKSEVVDKTKEFVLSQNLEFKRNAPVPINNDVQYITPPSLVNIYASGNEDVPLEVLKSEFEAAFNGTNPLTIRFPYLNDAGTINIVVDGVSTVLDDTTAYDFTLFEKLILTGDGFGNPYTTVKFNMEDVSGISNTATVFFELKMYDPLNQPPVISVASEVYVFADASSKTITATVTDPDGDPFTVIWQQTGGQPITMQNITTESLTLSNWASVGQYEFKITATDDRGNSSEAITTLIVMDYTVNVKLQDNNIVLYGGKVGETAVVDIDVTYVQTKIADIFVIHIDSTHWATVNTQFIEHELNTNDPFYEVAGSRTLNQKTFTKVFNVDGEIILPAVLANSGAQTNIHKVKIDTVAKIKSLTGGLKRGSNSLINFDVTCLLD